MHAQRNVHVNMSLQGSIGLQFSGTDNAAIMQLDCRQINVLQLHYSHEAGTPHLRCDCTTANSKYIAANWQLEGNHNLGR